jgi:hypothetical protein
VGSLLTITEVATRLGRHRRSIHNYLEKGFLRRVERNGKVLVPSEDVEQLAVELGTDFPALTRRTLFEMQAKIRKLEEGQRVFEKMWGIQEKPLRPSPNEAAGLLKATTDYLSNTSWRFEELNSWALLFNRVDEETLDALAEHGMTTKPWEPLYDLSLRMLAFIDKTKAETLELQALRATMESGRKKIREATLFWIERGRGTVPQQVFKLLDSPKEDLLRSLALGAKAKA